VPAATPVLGEHVNGGVLVGTYLYLYENQDSVYIGVADNMDRVWQPHNADAETLRQGADTRILQTVEPFSTRADALKAEAIAIHVAVRAGKTVVIDPSADNDAVTIEDEGGLVTVNRAGVRSTKVLAPAVLQREGTVPFADLRRTAIVSIAAGAMDGRPAPYGATHGAVFSERARKYWTVAADKRAQIERLIAVLKGSSGLILGDWDVAVGASYGPANDSFPLVDPANDDLRGVKGMRLVGDYRTQPSQIYSSDVVR
jgi:predicted GIY-YIG superfamily endonuclease